MRSVANILGRARFPGGLELVGSLDRALLTRGKHGTSNKVHHWLDSLGGLNEILERTMRKWWFKGLVEARCRPGSDLEGVEQAALRQRLETSYQEYMEKYSASFSSDSRTQMHVSCACLILATHASLSPLLRGHTEERIVEIIREHHGSKSKPLLQCVLTFQTFKCQVFCQFLYFTFGFHSTGYTVCRTLLKWTSILTTYRSMQQRLLYIQLDYGRDHATKGFVSTLKHESRMSSLRIHNCVYDEIFGKEDKGFLLNTTCCSADSFWLTATPSRSFTGGLASSKALGDAECVFYVTKT